MEDLAAEYNRLQTAKESAWKRYLRLKNAKACAEYEAACKAQRECWVRWQPFKPEEFADLMDG